MYIDGATIDRWCSRITVFNFQEFFFSADRSMAHPIHEASKSHPMGSFTGEEFFRKHRIAHRESFMLNRQGMKIFTQSWQPVARDQVAPLRGVVAMVHGYACDSSWVFQLTAVAVAKLGFLVCALDLRGHGRSDGRRGHLPNVAPAVDDCAEYFESVRAKHPRLPAFLYGESLGGALAVLICLRQQQQSRFDLKEKKKKVYIFLSVINLAPLNSKSCIDRRAIQQVVERPDPAQRHVQHRREVQAAVAAGDAAAAGSVGGASVEGGADEVASGEVVQAGVGEGAGEAEPEDGAEMRVRSGRDGAGADQGERGGDEEERRAGGAAAGGARVGGRDLRRGVGDAGVRAGEKQGQDA